jgi:hypothetical protein
MATMWVAAIPTACAFSFEPKLTLDGLLAFVGGFLAFIAIWRQTKKGTEGIERQLAADRQTRTDDANVRKDALATGLYFEVQNFMQHYEAHIKNATLNACPGLSVPGAGSLAVYRGSAGSLGELSPEAVEAVVAFYGLADRVMAVVNGYTESVEQELTRMGTIKTNSRPAVLIEQLKALDPGLQTSAQRASHLLSKITVLQSRGTIHFNAKTH